MRRSPSSLWVSAPKPSATCFASRQAYADQLAAAPAEDDVASIVQELFCAEDIPYGANHAFAEAAMCSSQQL